MQGNEREYIKHRTVLTYQLVSQSVNRNVSSTSATRIHARKSIL